MITGFKPNRTGFIVIGLLVLVLGIIAFVKRKKIKEKMSDLYNNLLDENGMFKTDKSQPRGIRNNNPGNLIKTNIKWKGKVENEKNSDGHFEQFYELKYGIRALIKDLKNDIQKGKNTLVELISEFAPSHENHTNSYINFVAKEIGVEPNQQLYPSYALFKNLVSAITKMENGKPVITENDFNAAWKIA